MINNSHQTVYRGFSRSTNNFVNLDDDWDDNGHNFHGTKEDVIEKLIEFYGPNWFVDIEIQRWQLTEERIDHITGDGIDYTKSF